jgi:hypothetical protein
MGKPSPSAVGVQRGDMATTSDADRSNGDDRSRGRGAVFADGLIKKESMKNRWSKRREQGAFELAAPRSGRMHRRVPLRQVHTDPRAPIRGHAPDTGRRVTVMCHVSRRCLPRQNHSLVSSVPKPALMPLCAGRSRSAGSCRRPPRGAGDTWWSDGTRRPAAGSKAAAMRATPGRPVAGKRTCPSGAALIDAISSVSLPKGPFRRSTRRQVSS